MKGMILTLFVLGLLSIKGVAQPKVSLSDLKVIEANYQTCLDKGENMLACSRRYYTEVDSVMRGIYEHLITGLKPGQQAYLVKEQEEWLKFRDRQFKIIEKENELELDGRDREMSRYHDEANIVKERALILLGRI